MLAEAALEIERAHQTIAAPIVAFDTERKQPGSQPPRLLRPGRLPPEQRVRCFKEGPQ